MFLLFREPAEGYEVPPDAIEFNERHRKCWDGMDFAKRYGLQLVGANFFVVSG